MYTKLTIYDTPYKCDEIDDLPRHTPEKLKEVNHGVDEVVASSIALNYHLD